MLREGLHATNTNTNTDRMQIEIHPFTLVDAGWRMQDDDIDDAHVGDDDDDEDDEDDGDDDDDLKSQPEGLGW